MRYIEADEDLAMRGKLLREAIEDDIKQGLVPFWVSGILSKLIGPASQQPADSIGETQDS